MIGICVGHSRKGDEGAYTTGSYVVSEWDFNRDIARRIGQLLDVDFKIYSDYELNTYSAAIRNVARKMRCDGVKAAVELHFNAASPAANGHEWLYWHSSKGGKRLAETMRSEMEDTYPNMVSRGSKPRVSRQRGSAFLRETYCYAIIAEPFFGTNSSEWEMINRNRGKLAGVYARALTQFVNA
jgi:N-acetylmuramoyl-L-alanine amidase|tara:strand:+ start:8848 stop:9396 length:549 start_codon:yes stop_codon:yes gene_type:complete